MPEALYRFVEESTEILKLIEDDDDLLFEEFGHEQDDISE